MDKLPSKIFIDGGEPGETKEASELMLKNFGKPLDGQTTNPSLIAKNLSTKMGGVKISDTQALDEYKRIVTEMSNIIPMGSISIQVFADENTTAEEMLKQARERMKWIPNASIKFPCTPQGLKAAEIACREMPLNITLVFSQAQAAAVYEATKNAKFPVFISPFVGRLDDRGENGMDVIANILKMYRNDAGSPERSRRVEVLTASVRTIDHLMYAFQLRSDIVTVPYKVFQLWADDGFKFPEENYVYNIGALKPIPFDKNIRLGKKWTEYDLHHDLTTAGVAKFFSDWKSVLQ